MQKQPAVRAGGTHDLLKFTETFRPGSLATIRGKIPPESLAAIDGETSWIRVEHHCRLADALAATYGPETTRRLYRQCFSLLVERPILRNLVLPTLRLFRTKPARILGMIPNGWKLGYRDFASFRVASNEPGRFVLVMEDVAPQAFEHPIYFDGWQGFFHGVLDLCRVSNGAVDMQINEAEREATATFTWS